MEASVTEDDLIVFADAYCEALDFLDKVPTEHRVRAVFDIFRPYPVEVVTAAIRAHTLDSERGNYPVTPADIKRHIDRMDGRPTAEEAWATASKFAGDETSTFVWSTETAEAWGAAKTVYRRDPVGARMVFRDTYNRIVTDARFRCLPVVWVVSAGTDPARREAVLRQSARLIGRNAAQQVMPSPSRFTPLPGAASQLALEGPRSAGAGVADAVGGLLAKAPAKWRPVLEASLKRVRAQAERDERLSQLRPRLEARRMRERKRLMDQKVQSYLRSGSAQEP